MSKKHIFVVGLDEFNREKLENLPQAADYEFHPALDYQDIQSGRQLDMKKLINRAVTRIGSAGVPVDGIVSFYDFPGTLLVPVVAGFFGVRSPALEHVLKCEHKYWSRSEQQKSIPDHIPQFFPFDPFDEDVPVKIPIPFPYWIKPVKSFLSVLAYLINNEKDYLKVIPVIQEKAGYFDEPFNHILELSGMRADTRQNFIAESLLSGKMCTAEGYVFKGEVTVYGMIDSVREEGRSSFSRYEYPSSVPREVQERIADIARRAITGIGLDNSAFNIEFFWDQDHDHIWLLEVNPRISQSHADLFEKVHGSSHHSVMLDIAMDQEPRLPEKNGMFRMAAKFMLRVFEDGIVTGVPGTGKLRQISRELPGTVVKSAVKPGDRLSELPFQDSYSYLLASVFIGGDDQSDLLDKYKRCRTLLDFKIRREDPYPVQAI
ncbi:MAG: ATP-grasp domain-containing protein [Balneolaceae bacterium]